VYQSQQGEHAMCRAAHCLGGAEIVSGGANRDGNGCGMGGVFRCLPGRTLLRVAEYLIEEHLHRPPGAAVGDFVVSDAF